MSTNQLLGLLSEMAVFVKVVDTGNFSEAARQLGMTPSATSRAVTRMEQALGTRLLQRTTRKLRLSESGQEAYAHCVNMVTAAQAVMASSGKFNQAPAGMITISVPKAVGRFVIHPHIPAFLAAYPEVDVHMVLDDRYVDLIDGKIDLAIRLTDKPPPGLMGRRLLDIGHVICATPQYLATHGTPSHPGDLKQHSCLCLGETPGDARWKFKRGTTQVTVDVHGRYTANHTGVRLDAVLQHIGIASLPYFIARHGLADGSLVQVLPQWRFNTAYCGGAWILYPPTRHLSPKLRVFIDFLAKRLEEEPTLIKKTGQSW